MLNPIKRFVNELGGSKSSNQESVNLSAIISAIFRPNDIVSVSVISFQNKGAQLEASDTAAGIALFKPKILQDFCGCKLDIFRRLNLER